MEWSGYVLPTLTLVWVYCKRYSSFILIYYPNGVYLCSPEQCILEHPYRWSIVTPHYMIKWRWQVQDTEETWIPQKTTHASPSWASYGVSFVIIFMKNYHIMKRMICISVFISFPIFMKTQFQLKRAINFRTWFDVKLHIQVSGLSLCILYAWGKPPA